MPPPPDRPGAAARPRTLLLFAYDWDQQGFARYAAENHYSHAGFDLFSFPSNAGLAWFDIDRFVDRLLKQHRAEPFDAVVSNHEQFGALAAAVFAERAGLPGTPVEAILNCQHKLRCRELIDQVAPQANPRYRVLPAEYGAPIPPGLDYPVFVKPIKAAFSVLARECADRASLHRHTRFGRRELWIIRRLVEPFNRIAQRRLNLPVDAHHMILEEPVHAQQYNLDGYVFNGAARLIGVVDEVMYPGTRGFMRFDYPSRLPAAVQQRAFELAQRVLARLGFTHGLFNMEFFHDSRTDRITIIEFNPRLASQMSDLYDRVDGRDLYADALALAHGRDPAELPRQPPRYGAAASFVYRSFDPTFVPVMPSPAALAWFEQRYPDGLLLTFPKTGRGLERDFKWLDSHRYAVMHLGAADPHALRLACEEVSAKFGWPAPYAPIGAAERTDRAAPGIAPAIGAGR